MYTTYRTKIKKLLSFPRLMALVALFLLVIVSLSGPLEAQVAFTQGYGTDDQLQSGMLVRLNEKDTSKVSILEYNQLEHMLGIVVDVNDALVTLSSDGQKVFIATSGQYDVLVSDQNGEIKTGDYLTASALNGIGMKASPKEQKVIGKALSGFNGRDSVAGSTDIKDSSGATKKINFGRIPIDIGIAHTPNYGSDKSSVPKFLSSAAESIAGKKVDSSRVYLAGVIFIICSFVAGTLMYAGVHSGIISIGRNPLSKQSIIRSLIQVILFGLIVFIIGIFGVYLLLKL